MLRCIFTLPALAFLAWYIPAEASILAGTEVDLDKLKSTTPANWKAGKPGNRFRVYQFSVPKAEGDAKNGEVVIFFFGPGNGGSADDNIKRWQKMFIQKEAGKVRSSVENFKVGKVPVTYLDVSGTYVTKNPPFDPNAKEERYPNYRMLGVYFGSENGPYFIRFTGPAKTVDDNKKGFDEWLKNFK